MNRSIDPKENGEYYPLTVWKTFLENFLDKLLQHRNNAMRLNALVCLDFDHYIDDQSELLMCEITRWKEKGKTYFFNIIQLTRLMLLHCAQTIITR
ncbi:hypothetical protein T12_129, partial [Trichinella patagoniensis]